MAIPLIVDSPENRALGHVGRFSASELVFSDEFNGSQIKSDRWRPELLVNDRNGRKFGRTLQQPNVSGQDNTGQVFLKSDGSPQFIHPEGKRHGAWYNDHRDTVQFVRDGRLVMRGLYTNERDPMIDVTSTIPGTSEKYNPYFDQRFGREVDPRFKAFASWLDTETYMEDPNQGNKKIIDQQSPALSWRYLYYEEQVDFTLQALGSAYRKSTWFMPSCDPKDPLYYIRRYLENGNETGVAYDGIPANGLEFDVYEREHTNNVALRQALLMKGISDSGSPSPEHTEGTGITYANDHGVDLTTEAVILGFYWAPPSPGYPNGTTQYFINGQLANRDDYRVSKIAHALFHTREANSGVNGGNTPTPYRPLRQADAGLFGDSMWEDPTRMNNCEVTVGYSRIWQENALAGDAGNPNTTWRSLKARLNSMIDADTPSGDIAGDVTSSIDVSGNWRLVEVGLDRPTNYLPPDVGTTAVRRRERAPRIRHAYSAAGASGYVTYDIDPAPPAGTTVTWNYQSWAGRAIPVGSTTSPRLVLRLIAEPPLKRLDLVTAAYQI